MICISISRRIRASSFDKGVHIQALYKVLNASERSDLLERQPDHELAPELGVELLGLRQHRYRDRGVHLEKGPRRSAVSTEQI